MGDQRREDSDRAQAGETRTKDKQSRDPDGFDRAHAGIQLGANARRSDDLSTSDGVHAVVGKGELLDLDGQLDKAIETNNATKVIALARDMSTEGRKAFNARYDQLAEFMSSREIAMIGGLADSPAPDVVIAMLQAKPPATTADLRAYFAEIGVYRMKSVFDDKRLVSSLRAKFTGSPIDIIPGLGDSGALYSAPLAEWFIDTTSPRVAAHIFLAIDPSWVAWQSATLNKIGEKAWKWLAAVDSALLSAASKDLLAKYHEASGTQQLTKEDKEDTTHTPVTDSGAAKHASKFDALAKAKPVAMNATALRSDRARIIATSTVFEIQERTSGAGMSTSEQLEWVLDKPGVTPAQIRQSTVTMDTHAIAFTTSLLTKLRRVAGSTPPTELFDGPIPDSITVLALKDDVLARWLFETAAPVARLRIIASTPKHIAAWCQVLNATGIGFGWVRELGGHYEDHLLRVFALNCTDLSTKQFIEERILGKGPVDVDTIATPVASPTAYSSGKDHLSSDLQEGDRGVLGENEDKDKRDLEKADHAKTVDADLQELSEPDLTRLRNNATELREVLQSANKDTFARVLERVQPPLHLVAPFVTAATWAPFTGWMHDQPAKEVALVLSNPMVVAQLQTLSTYSPLALFAQASCPPNVVAAALRVNTGLITWLLKGDIHQALALLSSSPVIDAAAHAVTVEQPTALDDRFVAAGRDAVAKIAAKTRGEAKQTLDDLLAGAPEPDVPMATNNATPPIDAKALLAKGDASALLTLLRGQPDPMKALGAANPRPELEQVGKLLALPVEVALPNVTVRRAIQRDEYWDWLLALTPPHRILDAFTEDLDQAVLAMLADPAAGDFLPRVPQGRSLSEPNKQALLRLAKQADDVLANRLFKVRFDTAIGGMARTDREKLWTTLERVPHAHVDQKSIANFTGIDVPADNGTGGVYYGDTRSISINNQLDGQTTKEYDSPETRQLTEPEAIEAIGSKEELEKRIADGRMRREKDGRISFVRNDNLESFTTTVLHEVGHAVDAMLGGRTEFIFKLAGWQQFSVSEFDSWATSLGGWERVSGPHRAQIKEAWTTWLRGGAQGTVAEMVDDKHPAVSTDYQGVGVVDLAQTAATDAKQIGSVVTRGEYTKQAFFNLSPRALHSAPSAYALTAPGEYFAECYANYYREFDGTPKTADKKGASLAPWIKGWFDENVDKIGHNPKRNIKR